VAAGSLPVGSPAGIRPGHRPVEAAGERTRLVWLGASSQTSANRVQTEFKPSANRVQTECLFGAPVGMGGECDRTAGAL
jgi:hypothetical protein